MLTVFEVKKEIPAYLRKVKILNSRTMAASPTIAVGWRQRSLLSNFVRWN